MVLTFLLFIGVMLLPCGLSRQLTASRKQSSLQSSSQHQANKQARELTAVPSFYHTQDEYDERLKRIASECKNLLTLETIEAQLGIVVAVIKAKENTKVVGGKKVAMLLFGEHAREVISSETALEFISDLCLLKSVTSEQAKRAIAILQTFDVYVVPVANPSGRAMVFGGAMCTRYNANGVDINRNWGYHWKLQPKGVDNDMYGGPHPFSEPETRAVKTLMERIKPYAFISIHSGAVGMYTPPGYTSEPEPDTAQLIAILDKVKQSSRCNCQVGAIGKEIGYVSYGNCLDYAHDVVGTKFAFAVEMYAQGIDSIQHGPCPPSGAASTLCAHQYYHSDQSEQRFMASRQQVSVTAGQGATDTQSGKCFAFFNPVTETDYHTTMAVWSQRFMLMLCGTVGDGKC